MNWANGKNVCTSFTSFDCHSAATNGILNNYCLNVVGRLHSKLLFVWTKDIIMLPTAAAAAAAIRFSWVRLFLY